MADHATTSTATQKDDNTMVYILIATLVLFIGGFAYRSLNPSGSTHSTPSVTAEVVEQPRTQEGGRTDVSHLSAGQDLPVKIPAHTMVSIKKNKDHHIDLDADGYLDGLDCDNNKFVVSPARESFKIANCEIYIFTNNSDVERTLTVTRAN